MRRRIITKNGSRIRIFLWLALTIFAQPGWSQNSDPIGSVLVSRGEVLAESADGGRRSLERGEPLFSGDVISTGAGARVRFKLIDDSNYVVQQNSSFAIENYHYNGSADGSENASFSLVGGAIEFLSGYIGKKNVNRFRMTTEFGTIGLRGSGGVVTTDDSGTRIFVTLGELTAVPKTGRQAGQKIVLINGETTVIRPDGSVTRDKGNSSGAPQTMSVRGEDLVSAYSAAEIYASLLPKEPELTQEQLGHALIEAIEANPDLYAELISVAIEAGLSPPDAAGLAIETLGVGTLSEDVITEIFFVATEGITDTALVEAAIIALEGTPLVVEPTTPSSLGLDPNSIDLLNSGTDVDPLTESCVTITALCEGASPAQ